MRKRRSGQGQAIRQFHSSILMFILMFIDQPPGRGGVIEFVETGVEDIHHAFRIAIIENLTMILRNRQRERSFTHSYIFHKHTQIGARVYFFNSGASVHRGHCHERRFQQVIQEERKVGKRFRQHQLRYRLEHRIRAVDEWISYR